VHARELRAFAAALAERSDELVVRREELRSALGGAGFAEAAAVAAAFHGYVRVADGTGIPVDELVVATSEDLRAELGVNAFAGHWNTPLDVAARPAQDFNPELRS
jgi:acyl-CoA reductase-like NAD-dependent aldehyde dehydrogenase